MMKMTVHHTPHHGLTPLRGVCDTPELWRDATGLYPVCAYARVLMPPNIRRRFIYTKGTRAHTQKELIRWAGLERASEGHEALLPPVLNACRRQKRQHLHRCRLSYS